MRMKMGYTWSFNSAVMGYFQAKTLVQVEALAAYALFQQPFHLLRFGHQHLDFGQLLLGQDTPAHAQWRVFLKSRHQRLNLRDGKSCVLRKLDRIASFKIYAVNENKSSGVL
jgi:hypothetical protein